MTRIDITQNLTLKKLLKGRYLQTAIQIIMLMGFVFTILAGFLGTPVGSHNFGLIFVWVAWWALLILVIVPFFGRSWCAICPIPLVGEWLQRGAILDPLPKRPSYIPRRIPRIFRNIWLQNIFFIVLALSSSVLLTTPRSTALVLSGMFVTGILLTFLFERRTFCRFLCPVGGFIGLYSQVAPLELRVKNKKICSTCREKPCYNGSSSGFGCPWDTFPTALKKNSYCGLCMECLRTCPNENIAVNIRPFASDLNTPLRRVDEAFKAFIMVGSAVVYAAVFLGPWANLKDAAYSIGSPAWFVYSLGLLLITVVLLPGLFWISTRYTQRDDTRQQMGKTEFAALSTSVIPLGLMFWIAFTLSFSMTNVSYILVTLSDPLGLGWNLFGTANIAWQPILTSLLPFLQTVILLIGLVWSAGIAKKITEPMGVSAFPIIAYGFGVTSFMMWLLL